MVVRQLVGNGLVIKDVAVQLHSHFCVMKIFKNHFYVMKTFISSDVSAEETMHALPWQNSCPFPNGPMSQLAPL